MAIGGERRLGKISRRHWERFAGAASIDADWVVATVREIAERLPVALEAVFTAESLAIGSSALPERLHTEVKRLSDVTLTLLDRGY